MLPLLTLAGASGTTIVLNLAFSVVTAKVMGPTSRGVVAIALTIGTTTSLVFSLGTNVAARYYLPKRLSDVTFGDYQGLGIALMVIQCGAAFGIATWLIGTGRVYGGITAIILTVIYSGLSLLSYLLFDGLNAFNYVRTSQLISASGSLVQLVGVLVLWAWDSVSIDAVLLVLALGIGVQVLAALFVLTWTGHAQLPRIRRRSSVLLVRKGVPALGYNAGQSFTFRLDRYVIAGYLGPRPLGIYTVAVAGSEMLRVFPWAWGQMQVFRVASGAVDPNALRRRRFYVVLAMAPLLVLWGWLGPMAVHPLLGARYLGAVTPWRLLMIGEIGVALYSVDAAILNGMGRTKASGGSVLVALATVLALDLYMIPRWGLDGAGVASAVAYLLMGVLAEVVFRRILRRDSTTQVAAGEPAAVPFQEVDPEEGLE